MKPDSKTLAAAALLVGLAGGWALAQWRMSPPAPAAASLQAAALSASAAGERKPLYWYDPMAPTQHFDRPGKSPFMDMDLVPKYADEAGAAGAGPALAVSAQATQSLGLRLAVADLRKLSPRIDADGSLGLNERDVSIVQARANGFVESVVPHAPGDVVAAGAPLAEVLHPEWLAAQREYLAVRATGDAVLSAASRARLTLLGMPDATVERLEASGQAQALTTIVAPVAGLITELNLRRGMTLSAGMTLARINGLGSVWVEAAVPEALAAAVVAGRAAEVRLAARPGEVLHGRVDAVLPEANRDSRTLRVRIELPNPGQRLRAGLSAQVTLQGAAGGEAVSVPSEAVIRTGRRALVYLLDAPGRYRPVEVEIGAEVDGRTAVLRGLQAGQQVVASGQFLIDSEASLQGLVAHGAPPPAASQPVATEYAAAGRVVELEREGITLEHEAVPALKWPAMTMPFRLERPDLARGLKAGDRVRFHFRQQGDEAVVTALERTPATAAAASAGASAGAGGRP
jgi:membrane fusion protein, copper/silver efflux system